MSAHRNQSGFTIIELMIATLVFSTVLLLCATGLISIGRMYQKGNTSRATQETARAVMDQIKNDFELTGGNYAKVSGPVAAFCIGDNLYINYATKLNSSGAGGLTVGQPAGGCATNGSVVSGDLSGNANVRQLLGQNMRVMELTIAPNPTATAPTSLGIRLNVVYGDDDLIGGSGCKGGAGQEYCAGSVLETYVTKRLKS